MQKIKRSGAALSGTGGGGSRDTSGGLTGVMGGGGGQWHSLTWKKARNVLCEGSGKRKNKW